MMVIIGMICCKIVTNFSHIVITVLILASSRTIIFVCFIPMHFLMLRRAVECLATKTTTFLSAYTTNQTFLLVFGLGSLLIGLILRSWGMNLSSECTGFIWSGVLDRMAGNSVDSDIVARAGVFSSGKIGTSL